MTTENLPSENPSPVAAPQQTAPKKRTGKPSIVEDAIVSLFGLATSAAVAYGSFASKKYLDFAVYTWMANFIIPIGAIICGFVAAVGYWIGARLFSHRPTKMLLINIVLVSLTTFFSIHHLDYSDTKINGRPLSEVMTFPDYLIAVTENMTYKTTGSSDQSATQLGKFGWGVAALQVIGFCLGGFGVYGMLTAVPYCDRCAKYFSEKRRRLTRWKDVDAMRQCYDSLAKLMNEGQLQAAIDQFSTVGEKVKFRVKGMLSMELRKCPDCENRRLKLLAQQRRGNQWPEIGKLIIPTEQPLRMG